MGRPFLWLTYLSLALAAWALFHRDAVRRAREWIEGVPGELEVQGLLAELESHGYRLLHDVKTRGGTVAAVAVGPRGVFAVHTRSWWPLYVSIRDRLLEGSWERDHGVEELLRAATELRDRLRAVGIDESVETLLVLTRVALPSGPVRLHNLTMLDATTLIPFVLTRAERLSSNNQIAMAAEAVRGGIPVAAAATTSSQTQNAPQGRGKAPAKRRAAARGASSTAGRKRPGRLVRSPEESPTPPARV